MSKFLIFLLPCILFSSCSSNLGRKASVELKVMTFNIRNGRAKDGVNNWNLRQDFVSDVIREYSADILGVQEAYRFQMDHLKKDFPDYEQVGIGRDGGEKGEYSAILYRKERFLAIDSGTFWLSDTPKKPSVSWGNRYRRICTWVRLIEKKSQRTFYVYNTHLDHQSQPAREKSVRLIIKRIQERECDGPFILTGDFNAGEDNSVVKFLKGEGQAADSNPLTLIDSFRVVHPDKKVVGTGNGGFKGNRDGPKIDYIFVAPKSTVNKANIDTINKAGRYPSDHYPVTADITLK